MARDERYIIINDARYPIGLEGDDYIARQAMSKANIAETQVYIGNPGTPATYTMINMEVEERREREGK